MVFAELTFYVIVMTHGKETDKNDADYPGRSRVAGRARCLDCGSKNEADENRSDPGHDQ
jgi:hypothetical protein